MKLRSCTLDYNEAGRVVLTLLSGDQPAVSVLLPENKDNPMYEPTVETLYSMALDEDAEGKLDRIADAKLEAQPAQAVYLYGEGALEKPHVVDLDNGQA